MNGVYIKNKKKYFEHRLICYHIVAGLLSITHPNLFSMNASMCEQTYHLLIIIFLFLSFSYGRFLSSENFLQCQAVHFI